MFADGVGHRGLRVVHYVVMSNHVHMICEAADSAILRRGMRSLSIRLALALNGLWGRTGIVIADRYHVHTLRTPAEVHNALGYVLDNARRHGVGFQGDLDPYSSAAEFDGWLDRMPDAPPDGSRPLARATTWLLAHGWRRHGLLELDTVTPTRLARSPRTVEPAARRARAPT